MIKTVHIHELSDVIFYCIEGDFDIVTDDGIVHLTEGDFVLIAKGTRHRLILTILVKCLLIEMDGILNKENMGGTYYQTNPSLESIIKKNRPLEKLI